MQKNPLFPQDPQSSHGDYALPGEQKTVQPLENTHNNSSSSSAADLIREKLERIYAQEPDTLAEEREAAAVPKRSPHQEFMYQLSTSGKSLAEIQTEWHNYYVGLPDDQKHQVWQEFYENNAPKRQPALEEPAPKKAKEVSAHPKPHSSGGVYVSDHTPDTTTIDKRSPSDIRRAIRKHIAAQTDRLPTNVKHSLHSLFFGLTTGFIVLLVFLFSFFNQVIIAPFIQPSRAAATPIIVNSESVDASTAKIIIPKINVEIPVVYDLLSNTEAAIQKGLESGVVHYPTTVRPGEIGNAAFFGHSSNNIFNKGKYKFAFVLLHKLEVGDTYYLTYRNTVYSYKVIDKKVVAPSQVGVLGPVPGQTASSTLITCDPPGTTLSRLIIVGQQISPDPSGNIQGNELHPGEDTTQITGGGPSLWSRFWDSIF